MLCCSNVCETMEQIHITSVKRKETLALSHANGAAYFFFMRPFCSHLRSVS